MTQRKRVFLILIISILVMFCGCNAVESGENGNAGANSCQVKFLINGVVYSNQTLEKGEVPSPVTPAGEGMTFAGWLDESGQVVSPETIPVTKDITYYALVFPDLNSHAPYLFADNLGLLRPDDGISGDEFNAALKALAEGAAAAYLPEFPGGKEILTRENLVQNLKGLFSAEAVNNAMVAVKGEMPTRSEFAVVMNKLLLRDGKTGGTLGENAPLLMDLTQSHPQFGELMEAAQPHSHTEKDITWEEMALIQRHPAGFFLRDGWLYYLNEDRTLARDTKVGVLQFDENGRYTSGDKELDALVAGILKEIMEKNPEAKGVDLLRKAYEYSRDSFSYLRRNAYAFGQTDWEIEDAKVMFTKKKGNCYNYAASFWALARGLGYEAKVISGMVLKDNQPHGWVEITMDGEVYVFDPEWEMVYHTRDKDFTKDMFKMTYSTASWWSYKRP